jgi:parvulin-like peptidyl-prolyl isomerase
LDLAKKKVEKPRREPTKRQLSRWQQQKRRQRFIFTIGMVIIVAILGVLGVGVYKQWYIAEYKPLQETVLVVNDTEFDMDYYIKMLEYYYYAQGANPENLESLTDEVAKAIEQNELIRQGAMKLGVSVSDSEVDEILNSYDPPLSKDYRNMVRTQMLVSKLMDDYFDEQVPTYAEQRYIFAMFLESESQVSEVRARLEAGEDFGQLAGELSLETDTKEEKGDLGWRPEGILSLVLGAPVLDEHAFSAEAGALSQPILDESRTKEVGYWLIKVLERDEEEQTAQVKVILLGSEQEAIEVRARLEAGEDFAQLVQEFSQHIESQSRGGDFEALREIMSPAFSDFAFSSELDVLSQPIRDDTVSTKGGYWLVKVSEIDNNRQIMDVHRSLLKADALNNWLNGLFSDPENEVENYLDMGKKLFAISHVLRD